MRNVIIGMMAAAVLSGCTDTVPTAGVQRGNFEVFGVEDGDLLKMRAGPGTGYEVIVGLPNGTVVRVHECQQTGGTRWCSATTDQARGVRGFVSWAYLREI